MPPENLDTLYLLQRMAESCTGKQTGELLLHDVSGKLITVLTNMVCVTDSVTGVRSWRTAIIDISDRKRNENALHQAELAQSTAESANQAKSQFLSAMSHEIRTPLNGLLGMTELLLNTKLDAEQQGFAHIARRSGDSLLGILNDVLDLSKIEAGKLEIEAVRFDVWQVARDVTALYVDRARGKRIELACQINDDVPIHAIGDPVRLTQIVTNLVSNAIKFTGAGVVSLRV